MLQSKKANTLNISLTINNRVSMNFLLHSEVSNKMALNTTTQLSPLPSHHPPKKLQKHNTSILTCFQLDTCKLHLLKLDKCFSPFSHLVYIVELDLLQKYLLPHLNEEKWLVKLVWSKTKYFIENPLVLNLLLI